MLLSSKILLTASLSSFLLFSQYAYSMEKIAMDVKNIFKMSAI